jgi:hypothetical protein
MRRRRGENLLHRRPDNVGLPFLAYPDELIELRQGARVVERCR